jgi:hypothetical protein
MTALSRTKGLVGEREVAGLIRDITGWEVRRRVRQHDRDSDLEGVPGWLIEVKRHAAATRSVIAGWWVQCEAQGRPAAAGAALPPRPRRLARGLADLGADERAASRPQAPVRVDG